MNAHDIVKALAESDEPTVNRHPPARPDYTPGEGVPSVVVDIYPWCVLCGSEEEPDDDAQGNVPVKHHDTCPWRMAREYMAEGGGTQHAAAWLDPDTNEAVTHEPEDPARWVRLYRKDEG